MKKNNGMPRWRSHLIYRGWSIWAYCKAPTLEEAKEVFRQQRAYKGREWITPASVVDAGAVSMDQQKENDKYAKDWAKEERTPDQQATFKREESEYADILIRGMRDGSFHVTKTVLEPHDADAVDHAKHKRWEQMQDDGYGEYAELERREEKAVAEVRRANTSEGYNQLIQEFHEFCRERGLKPE